MDVPAADVITLSELGTLVFRYGLLTILSIALVIIVHEFGHYLAARSFGIKVTKFSLGFGKELFGYTDRWGTRWCVSRLPIGGYVSIFGDVDRDNPIVWDRENNCERRLTDEELKVAFCTRKVWQRMIVVAAGPAINMFFAYALIVGLSMVSGVSITPPVVKSIVVGSASYDAGLQLGDRILEMDGKKITDFQQIYEITSKDWERPHVFVVLRGNETLSIRIQSREQSYTDKKGVKREKFGRVGMLNPLFTLLENVDSVDDIDTRGDPEKARQSIKERFDSVVKIGIYKNDTDIDYFLTTFPSALNKHLDNPKHDYYDRVFINDKEKVEYEYYNILKAGKKGYEELKQGFQELGRLLSVLHKGKTKEGPIGGVIKIGKYAGNAMKEGSSHYILFLVMLSIVVAMINIMPIPLLDGGFLIFLIYEAVTGRSVSPRVQNLSFAIALVFLGGIMILANLIDLIDFLNP